MFGKFSSIIGKTNVKLTTFNKINTKSFNDKLTKFGFKEKLSNPAVGYGLVGLGVGGLGYLMWRNGHSRADYSRNLIASGNYVSNDISLRRTRDTMVYFSGGLALTSALTGAMLRSPTILKYSMGWGSLLLTIPGTMFCMYQMYTTPPLPENALAKHVYWTGFNALIAFSLVPLIASSHLLAVRDAFIVTSGALAGLGLVASNARDDAFLGMSGFLGAGLGGIAVIGIANIFMKSNALFNVWLYGGLALFLAYVLYDMKEVQLRAKRAPYFDPMSESIKVYLDFVNIFVRILMIMNGRRDKK